MIRKSALSLFLALFVLSSVQAGEITALSRVSAVTVYPGSAMVTREATVDLPAGATQVIIEGLPASIDASLVTASGRGEFRIEGVEVRRRALTQASSPRVRELEEKIEGVQKEIAGIDAEIQSLEASSMFLDRLAEQNRQAGNERAERGLLRPEDIASVIESYGTQSRAITKGLVEARERKRISVRSLDALQRELRELQAQARREAVNAVISVGAERAVRGTVVLRYAAHGATWEPVYEARGMMEEGKVRLTYAASIRQSTGEDWTDAKIELSTARPSLGASVPDLSPLYLSPRVAEPWSEMRARGRAEGGYSSSNVAQAPMPMAMAVAEEMAPPEPEAQVVAAQVRSGVNATFEIRNPATVLSDNQPRKVTILDQEFACAFVYRAVPELSERAYVVAKFVNPTQAQFLGGAVAVYQGGDYVGKSVMREAAPADTIEIQLGFDPSIEVKRRVLENVIDPSTGFGRNRSRLTRRYAVEVTNLRNIPVTMNVYERIPVSRHDDIKVERIRGNVDPTETREDGITRWAVSIPARGKTQIESGYRVEYPADMNVAGL